MSLSAILKERSARQSERAARVSAAVSASLVAADELENDCRAALGLEINSVMNNQRSLDEAVKRLQTQITGVTRATAGFASASRNLVHEYTHMQQLGPWLEQTQAVMEAILANFDYIQQSLTSEG